MGSRWWDDFLPAMPAATRSVMGADAVCMYAHMFLG